MVLRTGVFLVRKLIRNFPTLPLLASRTILRISWQRFLFLLVTASHFLNLQYCMLLVCTCIFFVLESSFESNHNHCRWWCSFEKECFLKFYLTGLSVSLEKTTSSPNANTTLSCCAWREEASSSIGTACSCKNLGV